MSDLNPQTTLNLYNEDCLITMKNIQDETIDLIIADPPYYQVKGDFDFIWKNKNEYLEWSKKWLLEAQRILKPTGTLILWGGVGKNQIMMARLAILLEDDPDLILFRQNWVSQKKYKGHWN